MAYTAEHANDNDHPDVKVYFNLNACEDLAAYINLIERMRHDNEVQISFQAQDGLVPVAVYKDGEPTILDVVLFFAFQEGYERQRKKMKEINIHFPDWEGLEALYYNRVHQRHDAPQP